MSFNSGFSGGSKVCPLYGGGTAANPANILVMQAAPPAAVANQPGDSPIGTIWINVLTGNSYQLVQNTYAVGQVWTLLGGAAGAIATINSQAPVAGNYVLAGTANQITKTDTAGTTTFSLPAAITAPGSVTATTTLTATLGAITATNGNLVLSTAGNKLSIATGANASLGTSAAMTAGAITISTTAVTASSKIFVSHNTLNGTPGAVSAPTASIVAGTSFDITSSSNTDTSTVNWWIIN